MTDEKGPIDRAVDLFVYAPIGFAVLAREFGAVALADLAKRGRSEVDQTQKRLGNQITQYRFIGQYAVDHEIGPRVAPLVDEVRRVVDRFTTGIPDAGPAPAAGNGLTAEPPVRSDAPSSPPVAPSAPEPAASPADRAAERAAAAALPIPDYDELSASHVVERLAGLTPSELSAIADYEAARRRRKTILTRIEQLTR